MRLSRNSNNVPLQALVTPPQLSGLRIYLVISMTTGVPMFTAVGQSTAILFDMTASDTTPVSQMVNQRWAPKGDDDFITRAHKQRIGSKYR